MCALKKPFDASNLPAIIFSIMRNKPHGIPEEYSDHLKKMVKLLLSANPTERPSLAEIEALPVIQHYMNKWREDYRELEVAAGLGPSAITAPSSRTGATGPGSMSTRSPMMAAGSPGGGDWAASSIALTGVGSAAAPLTSPAATKASVAAFEREVLREIEEFAVEAETAPGTGSAGLHTRIDECQRKLEAGPAVSGRVWEALGRAWADSGQFSRAIAAYRRSLRAKSSNASLVAMEQLGNLLVRRAQQVWSQARAGDPEGALKAAEEVLAGGTTSASALLQRITAKKARGAKAKRSSSAAEDDGGTEEDEEDVPAWARAASALMYEGLAYIERMCSLGNTAERRSLLGSAYKRRAWTGLGESRKEDLIQAASNYAAAHEIEMEDGKENPSPYARLNQLTLEMLAGSGTSEERER
jgi:tetratricopeptide (TPR) repeat protein